MRRKLIALKNSFFFWRNWRQQRKSSKTSWPLGLSWLVCLAWLIFISQTKANNSLVQVNSKVIHYRKDWNPSFKHNSFYNLACVFVRPVLPCLLIILAVGDMKKSYDIQGHFSGLKKVTMQFWSVLERLFNCFVFIRLGSLSRNFWSSLDHNLMASIWEKANSILNSGCSYLITAVVSLKFFERLFDFHQQHVI